MTRPAPAAAGTPPPRRAAARRAAGTAPTWPPADRRDPPTPDTRTHSYPHVRLPAWAEDRHPPEGALRTGRRPLGRFGVVRCPTALRPGPAALRPPAAAPARGAAAATAGSSSRAPACAAKAFRRSP